MALLLDQVCAQPEGRLDYPDFALQAALRPAAESMPPTRYIHASEINTYLFYSASGPGT